MPRGGTAATRRPETTATMWAAPGGNDNMLLRILDRLEEILIATLIAAATVIIFVAVVHRYGTGVPFLFPYFIQIHLSWAQEPCIYMFILIAQVGPAYVSRTRIHLGHALLVHLIHY